jgi:threonine/homoserine/homoserine lactone efflux protein
MNSHIALSLFHILVVAPFFLYVAFVRGQLMPFIFTVLQILGILILVYHSYKTMIKWKANSLSVWVNIVHIVAVAPLLLYIGSRGFDTPRWAFEVLAMVGFAALGYHFYNLIINIKEETQDHHIAKQKKVTQETEFYV